MVIDSHAHVTAPDSLYVYKAGILAHRGAHGRGSAGATDDDIIQALNKPVFGGSSHLEQLKEAGTDLQLISPRPYQMMHRESNKLVTWYIEETNNIIARQCALYPNTFRGVCGLPQGPGISPKNCIPELERCVKQHGFVGCLINPDPGECSGIETPPLGDRYWYPLYEKLVELDVAGHIHSAGCCSERLTYSLHFINEESIAVVSLLSSNVFKDFPTLKILVSHGGGAIPYQFARFEASFLRRGGERFQDRMRNLWYDTVLYSRDALELLFKTVGADRCLFGTERPGVGTVKDPRTGRWLDETRHIIEGFDFLSAAEKKLIFEDNAKTLFKLDAGQAKGVSS
ncbi:MAG TPA: amidohydrolase family protein [Bryobacteraceae bacterium]|nr:amidohydrolase family protein [Bryobacteraceae bacterium]